MRRLDRGPVDLAFVILRHLRDEHDVLRLLVACDLSGHEFDTILGKVTIRAEDHQLLKPNYFGVVEDVGGTLRPVIP